MLSAKIQVSEHKNFGNSLVHSNEYCNSPLQNMRLEQLIYSRQAACVITVFYCMLIPEKITLPVPAWKKISV